jgi:squalene-hopene/tetraprenyl-beta-curcumene cyclase
MMRGLLFNLAIGIAGFCAGELRAADNGPLSWDSKAAAAYLDGRETWWMGWSSAARDHGTFCVSCHTVLPYALARPALRQALHESAPSEVERKILDNVTKRVRIWNEALPFYNDKDQGVPKTAEARGTEAVLNALILVTYGSPEARAALDNMWALQLTSGDAKGAFSWLNFHNQPWEGDSQYWGATLAAIAAGSAPADYRGLPEVQGHVDLLREYLVRERESQILLNRTVLVWASAKLPGLLNESQKKAILDEVIAKQEEDGGWSSSSLVGGWKRKDGTPLETRSDGYATGVVTFVMQQNGMQSTKAALDRGLRWLAQNQDKSEGLWPAWSLNKKRDPASNAGRFMSDAATAYAVLALTQANQH